MAVLKIKKVYAATRIAFGKSGLPLSARTQAELVELAIIAHESKDPTIIKLFETLPDLETLKKMQFTGKILPILPKK